jgi:hypothetical protein
MTMTTGKRQFADVLRATERTNAGALMLEMILKRAVHPDAINAMFKRTAERQYTHELLFSTLVDLMLLVVLDKRNSVHRNYLSMSDEVGVSVRAVDDKLARTETDVSEDLLTTVPGRCSEIIDAMPASSLPSPLGDIPVVIADGDHLARTPSTRRDARQRGGTTAWIFFRASRSTADDLGVIAVRDRFKTMPELRLGVDDVAFVA